MDEILKKERGKINKKDIVGSDKCSNIFSDQKWVIGAI